MDVKGLHTYSLACALKHDLAQGTEELESEIESDSLEESVSERVRRVACERLEERVKTEEKVLYQSVRVRVK